MNRHPSHRQSSKIRSHVPSRFAKGRSRVGRLLAQWRQAELDKYNATPGAPFSQRVKACKDALNLLREVADSLLAKGHP